MSVPDAPHPAVFKRGKPRIKPMQAREPITFSVSSARTTMQHCRLNISNRARYNNAIGWLIQEEFSNLRSFNQDELENQSRLAFEFEEVAIRLDCQRLVFVG
jgi:hypothetical protein